MAYKRELIINNGALTSYKKLLKVSDICQLLDKSKYSATQTINGVTFTNNGDGTITYNGVTSVGVNYVLQLGLKVVSGHKYFSCTGKNMAGKISVLLYADEDPYYTFDNRFPNADGAIVTALKNSDRLSYQPKPQPNISFSNFVLKPQLFDLTEMYGAGNEPATVAEFKAKFPNDLYDYSPRCWVKSYKTGLIAKTKNLFNNIPVKTNTQITESGVEEYVNGYNVYSKIYGNDFTISANAPIDLTATDNWLRVCLYNSSGAFIARRDFNFSRETVVHIVDNTMSYMQLCVSSYTFPNYKLQVEKGQSATDYVPYGYL